MTDFPQFGEPTRRDALRRLARAAFGVSALPALGRTSPAAEPTRPAPAKRVIYLFLSGAVSQLETFDPKPGREAQAGTEVIPTKLAGVRFGEYLPELARRTDRLAVVRSLSTSTAAHDPGCYLMRTNYRQLATIRHPTLGAWLHRFRGRPAGDLPATVQIGGGEGPGYLGAKFAPVPIGDPAKGLQNTRPPKYVTDEKFARRMKLAKAFDAGFRRRATARKVSAYDDLYRDAIRLLDSRDLAAFDVSQEPETTRRSYGEHRFGTGCLLARRLIEADVPFVEVTSPGWDHHNDLWKRLPDMARRMDATVSTLLDDLADRGLLDDTLVVLATEFGRKPERNRNDGRDHHPAAFSCALAGAGIATGQVYGATDEDSFYVADGHATVQDFNATIARVLGLPLEEEVVSPSGRPFTLANGGEPITGLLRG